MSQKPDLHGQPAGWQQMNGSQVLPLAQQTQGGKKVLLEKIINLPYYPF